jgi:hypothetical protein
MLVSVAIGALFLSGLAVWPWRTAVGQRDRADTANAEAQANATEAKANAQKADANARQADANATEAKANADKTEANASEARANAVKANARLREAQIAQSRFLADSAPAPQKRAAQGDAGTTVLLALEALPDSAAGVDRPYVPEAGLRLDGAWRDLRERLDIGHYGAVYGAAFSPDGKRIVSASQYGTARVWDAASGKPFGDGAGYGAAFSPDGKRIVAASDDDTARVWDAASGNPIGEPLKGHENAVLSAAFSPDGKRIVTASDDKTARVWDAATGKPIGEPLKGHEGVVRGASFSPDGKRIVTASDDKTARMWDVFPDTQALVSVAKAAGRVSPHQTGSTESRAHFEHLPKHAACSPKARKTGTVPRHPAALE